MSETPRSVGDGYGDAYGDAYDDDKEEEAVALPLISQSIKTQDRNAEDGDKDENDPDDGEADEDSDDGDDDDDAKELAEMFAKVQTLQQAEGIHIKQAVVKPPPQSCRADKLEVVIPEHNPRRSSGADTSSSSGSVRSRSRPSSSPAAGSVGLAATRSPDGITTICRKALASGRGGSAASINVLSGVKRPELFQTRLLQDAKQQPHVLEKMTKKVAATAPATIAKRIETLSEPKRNDLGRKFALDDDAKHCRFSTTSKRKKAGDGSRSRDAYDDDGGNSAAERTSDFIARMEAAERNKQKKLELTRGEKEYLANLSYSEHRDKKKRCQMCGSEFRVPQAWGDVGGAFISRISEDSRQRDERKDQIRARVVATETLAGRVPKSSTQQYYEKTLQQRNEHKTFLDRNYTPISGYSSGGSSSAKTKQAQLQLQLQLQAQAQQRAKLLTAAQPPIY